MTVRFEQDDAADMDEAYEFRSRRGRLPGTVGLQDDMAYRCQSLVKALDSLNTVEDRVDLVMTDILKTGGSWHVSGPGEVPPSAVLVEVQVHGVRALGRDITQAIANWTAAARRMTEEQGEDL